MKDQYVLVDDDHGLLEKGCAGSTEESSLPGGSALRTLARR
jgi:hypothetical protein